MRLPPPFLELGFYLPGGSTTLLDLTRALIDMGARLTGEAWAHIGEEAGLPFASRWDYEQSPLSLVSLDDLERLEADHKVRVTKLAMLDASGRGRKWHEMISFCDADTPGFTHAVSVWTSAALWSTPIEAVPTARTRAAGRAVYTRLLRLISVLRPHYAAITCLEDLHRPEDYRRDPRTRAFRSFYIEKCFLQKQAWDRVIALTGGGRYYIEEVADGMYFSCDHDFNPLHRSLPSLESEELSVEIACLIGNHNQGRRS